jgi:hypothetical protein
MCDEKRFDADSLGIHIQAEHPFTDRELDELDDAEVAGPLEGKMTDFKELGAIAVCVKHIGGITLSNPFPEGSIAGRCWQRGFDEEMKRIKGENQR